MRYCLDEKSTSDRSCKPILYLENLKLHVYDISSMAPDILVKTRFLTIYWSTKHLLYIHPKRNITKYNYKSNAQANKALNSFILYRFFIYEECK